MAATRQMPSSGERPGTNEISAPDAEFFPATAERAGGDPSRRRFARRAAAIDAAMLAVTGLVDALTSPTTSLTGSVPYTPVEWVLAMSLAILGVFYLRGMYAPPLRLEQMESLRMVVAGTAVGVTVAMTARVFMVDQHYVAAETVRYWMMALPLLAAGRWALLWSEGRARRKGERSRRTLIVGGGRVGTLTAERLLKEPELGLRPVAFLDDDPGDLGSAPSGLPILGAGGDFEALARQLRIDHVIIAFSRASHEELLALARTCWRLGISVSVIPRLFEIQGQRVFTEHLGGLPLMEMRAANPDGWQFRVKYAIERLVAAAALVLLLPLVVAASVAVLVSMGRPLFYRQRRVGRDGQEFEMLKLRTLREPSGSVARFETADADWAAQQSGSAVPAAHVGMDDRLTRVGAFLRRYSLDELPQLWNVVRGEMALVGPRPETVAYVKRFEGSIYRYDQRHRMKTGLTGWAQVNGLRGRTPLADRVEWDNHYIENWSPWLDFKIVLKTVAGMGAAGGAGRERPDEQ